MRHKYFIYLMFIAMNSVGCAELPFRSCARSFPGANLWSNYKYGIQDDNCGLINGEYCHPRNYLSWTGYDAFWDKIVTRDAASCQARAAFRKFRQGNRGAYSIDFRYGFDKAYFDVANGYPLQLPAVPPPVYWAAANRTYPGHTRAADWYAGYEAALQMMSSNPQREYNVIPGAAVLADEGILGHGHVPIDEYPIYE